MSGDDEEGKKEGKSASWAGGGEVFIHGPAGLLIWSDLAFVRLAVNNFDRCAELLLVGASQL